MRYTPKEMLAYASRDPETRFGAYIATYNNKEGFSYLPIDPENVKIDGNTVNINFSLRGEKDYNDTHIQLPLWWIGRKNREILKKADHSNTRIFLTRFRGSFGLATAYGKEDDRRDEAVMDCLILEFFKLARIDTKKKLKAVIKKGWEIRSKTIIIETRCVDFLDACMNQKESCENFSSLFEEWRNAGKKQFDASPQF